MSCEALVNEKYKIFGFQTPCELALDELVNGLLNRVKRLSCTIEQR